MKYILATFLSGVVVFAVSNGVNAGKAPVAPVEPVTPPKVFLEMIPTEKGFDVRIPEDIEMGEVAKLFVESLKKEGRIACKK